MDYRNQEYLDLFKKVQQTEEDVNITNQSFEQLRGNSNNFNHQMIKETPSYNNYEKPMNYNQFENLNEVQRNPYNQDLNLNEFNIETKVNGQNINEVHQKSKEEKLNEIMQRNRLERERLNEVKRHQEQEIIKENERIKEEARLAELKRLDEEDERRKLNESVSFGDADVVSVEMFEKARFNSMMQVANMVIPK